MTETWKPVPGNPLYEVSDEGRMRSWSNSRRRRTAEPHPIAPTHDHGYLKVGVHGRMTYLHILVLTAFRGPPPPGMECCHNNGDRADCRLSNLRWDTRKANAADRVPHGTHARGEKNPRSKLTDAQTEEIRGLIAQGRMTQRAIAAQFGVTPQLITNIKNGHSRRWYAA